ncbi:MAG: LON peptidase substrate-binding domain-containing protein [Candidatus Poribacteria bacterium]|nr:LON peptidase substrate-binding domain-containing protein [Candidatus Poribacteria bacterium]
MTEPEQDGIYMRLFPLNMVLYPGMPLPLHIFEDRYKTMIGECIREEQPFGVVLIRHGFEVGGAADVYSVGTTARIQKVQELDGGRMNLLTVGETRFEIIEFVQREPFMSARVKMLPPPAAADKDAFGRLASQVSAAFLDFNELMSNLDEDWQLPGNLPDDPVEVMYRIASSLPIPHADKQDLLAADNADETLKREYAFLGERLYHLRAVALTRRLLDRLEEQHGEMPRPFRLN